MTPTIAVLIIFLVTCAALIALVFAKPSVMIGGKKVSIFWLAPLAGALALVIGGFITPAEIATGLTGAGDVNPLKILLLFFSMTMMSVYLDEIGFFRLLAHKVLSKAKGSQLTLFFLLYGLVSILTVFTSNDIIVLTFTPFICHFAKSARIDPLPYLVSEFVAANTWSMALIIGNPTNIYLVTAAGGSFLPYVKVMLLPTLAAGAIAFGCLFLLFRKKLRDPIKAAPEEVVLEDKFSLWVGIVHLVVCTVLLAIGSYLNIEMWLVSFLSAISLFIWCIGIAIFRKRKPTTLVACLKRAPWELIPFILSMFVMVEALSANQVTDAIYGLLGSDMPVWKYGITSFLACNLINNIPMSVLYSSILPSTASEAAVYATVVGSNLGACLTPIGALAGIMWSSILKTHGLKFGYLDFLKIGVSIAIPALLAALGVLQIIYL